MAGNQDTSPQKTPSIDKAEGLPTDTGRDPEETHGRDRTGQAADRAGRGRETDADRTTSGNNLGPSGDPAEGSPDKTAD